MPKNLSGCDLNALLVAWAKPSHFNTPYRTALVLSPKLGLAAIAQARVRQRRNGLVLPR